MNHVSDAEYQAILAADQAWANGVVEKIHNDPRFFVRYKNQRPITSIKQMLESSTELYGDRIAFHTKLQKGPYQEITYKEMMADINGLGTALIAKGYKEKRLAIIGETNYTWSIADLAIVSGVGVAVPLDKELPYADLKNLINESEASIVFCDKKREPLFTKMLAEGETGLQMVVAQNEHEDKVVDVDGKQVPVYSQWKLIEEGKALVAEGNRDFIDAQIDASEMAIIIFTSGTTGMAKGIMLSNRNICADLMVAPTVLNVMPTDIFFSTLPIHHTYEYTCDFLMPLYKGASIAHCEGLMHITKNLKEAKPTMFLGVPAIFETLDKKIWQNIRKKGKESSAKTGIKLSLFFRRKLHMDISNVFFKEIKEVFGGNMRMIISGGAAINPAILDELNAFGMDAVQGYGLSECAPMGALNPDTYPKSYAAGTPFPGCDAKIANPGPDGVGEICLKGDNVMLGYYKRPDLTAEVIKDGWFYTGDLGNLDDEKFIVITGRAKNVIICKNGKNVFPEELEYHLCLNPEIAEAMCFEKESDNKDDTKIAASIYPDWEYLKETMGGDADDLEKVTAKIDALVDAFNKENPGYKMIREILIRHKPLEKNTSNKVVRFRPANKEAN